MQKQIVFLLVFLSLQGLSAQDRLTGETFTTRSEVLARNGMAATSQPLATQAALDIIWTSNLPSPWFLRLVIFLKKEAVPWMRL